jgi:hypothetical protein
MFRYAGSERLAGSRGKYSRDLPIHENHTNPYWTSGVTKVDWRGHLAKDNG